MSFPRWLTVWAWSLFGLIALAPVLRLTTLGWADGFALSNWTAIPWRLLGASVLIAGGSSALALLFGVPCAWLCARTDLWAGKAWSVACLIPLLIPPYLHALAWKKAWADAGLLASASVGPAIAMDVHSASGVIVVLGCAYFPLVMLLVLGGLNGADASAEESARMQQGAGRTLARVTFPLMLPHILTGTLLVFLFALLEFGVPDLLRVRVYTVEIFIQFSAFYDPVGAVRLAMPLLAITMGAVALQVCLMRGRRYLCFSARPAGGYRHRLGWGQLPALAFTSIVLAASVLLPLSALVLQARLVPDVPATLAAAGQTLLFSIATAAAAASLMTILSFVIAHQVVRTAGFQRLLVEYLIHLPLAVPPILLGIALIQLWNRAATEWLYGSSLMVVIGYVARFIPFALRVVVAHGEQLPPQFEESAALLACPARAITRITLPLLAPGLRLAFAVAFVLALGELGVTLLVIPPGRSTLPISLYNYLHYGAEPVVALLSLVLLGLQLAIIAGLSAIASARAEP